MILAPLWMGISQAVGLEVEETPKGLTVRGKGYRMEFLWEMVEFRMEVLDAQGQFRPISRWSPEFGLMVEGQVFTSVGSRAEWAFRL